MPPHATPHDSASTAALGPIHLLIEGVPRRCSSLHLCSLFLVLLQLVSLFSILYDHRAQVQLAPPWCRARAPNLAKLHRTTETRRHLG